MSKRTVYLLLLSGTLVLGAFHPSQAEARTYRRINKGVGNCIFSASPLPANKEATYRGVTTVFNANTTKVIYARCYHQKMSAYEKLGRVYNSLRSDGKSWVHFKWMGINSHKWRSYNYSSSSGGHKSMGYYYLGKIADCDYCSDLLKIGRALGGDRKPMKFCVETAVPYADRYKREWIWDGNVRKQVTDNVNKIISRGCFTLTFK